MARLLLSMKMMPSLDTKVSIPDGVMFRDLAGESVLLDIESGRYFGLDEVGTRMWISLQRHGQIGLAARDLLEEYEVQEGQLCDDLVKFVYELTEQRLLQLADQ